MPKFVAWFSEIDKNDSPLVGEKGANLGEMQHAGFPIPNGFVITSNAYHDFIKENKLDVKIKHLLSTANFASQKSLEKTSKSIRKHIQENPIPQAVVKEVVSSYLKLGDGGLSEDPLVTINTSENAFKIKGDAVFLEKTKQAWASFFDAKQIYSRYEQGLDPAKAHITLVVQRIIESKTFGLMFTIDPTTNDKSKIIIKTGKNEYAVKKPGFSILAKNVDKKQAVSNAQIIELAKLGDKIEKHCYFPQEIKWVIEDRQIYVLQIKPITITGKKPQEVSEANLKLLQSDLVLTGSPVSHGIASGPVKMIFAAKEIDKVMPGDILVLQKITHDLLPAIKKASALITDSTEENAYAAIVSKEIKIPAVFATELATEILRTGNIITVNGTKGEIYRGGFATKQTINSENKDEIKTATKLYINLTNLLNTNDIQARTDGALFNPEQMIMEIGIHPKKMIKDGKKQEFIDKLAESIAIACKTFSEKPVIYKFSDLKTDQYRALINGKEFEPIESNPNLGFRGAFRYIHDREMFELELEAVKTVREKMGYSNLHLMIPFVRTVEELIQVKNIIKEYVLEKPGSFKLWMMLQIPSNVIMLEKFIEAGIDGIMVDSDCLTMLIMGSDKENFEVSNEFNEMYPANIWAFDHIIKTANKHGIISSICGQAVTKYPELTRKLVCWGINSVAVPFSVISNTRKILAQTEKELFNY